MWKPFAALATALALMTGSSVALAAYPEKPVKFVVGYAPGAAVDMVTRKLAEQLQRITGQPFIVENRPGVGGMVGAAQVANAQPDGYTLLAYDNTYVSLPAVTRKLAVDPIRAFVPVTTVIYTPGILVVPGNSPHKTLAEFIAYAKAHPGKMNYGAGSQGGSVGLGTEEFKLVAGVDIQYVPFKGGAETVVNLISNQIDMALLTTGSVASHIQSGRLRALAVTGSQRLPLFPAVPTFEQAGLPGFSFNTWTGVVLPVATPKPIVERLRTLISQVLETQDMREYIVQLNARPGGQSSEAFAQQIAEENKRWVQVAQRVGLAEK